MYDPKLGYDTESFEQAQKLGSASSGCRRFILILIGLFMLFLLIALYLARGSH
jgi:hypothetical protein